jgi:Tol biopolymer transport system component
MIGSTLLHYRIVRALGSGGMGEVYAAEDTKLHRIVALKILPAATASDPERLARFQREAQAIAALNHPNVVTIYSVEEAAGTHFLTMELVEGKTLAELIPPHGFMLAEFLKITVPLTDAVSAAHAQGVVHRDLKPSNVMIGPGGRVKVLDFGLAKLRQETLGGVNLTALSTDRLTAPHHVFGTPAYMSPEQAEGRSVDHRTDVFSLGIMLYEMVTGRRPFAGDSPLSVLSSILKDTPAPVGQVRPDLPADLDRILRRCLAKDPARRYQTAIDLKTELEDLESAVTAARLADAPASTSSIAVPRRPRAGRYWRAAALTIVSLGVALVLTGRFGWPNWTRTESGASIVHPVFTQLTSAPAAELFPSLSPDGRWIVYAGEGAGNRDIYLQSTSGQTPINLTEDSSADDEQPAFSPDGEHIAFRSGRDGGGLFVMGRTGEAVRRITRAGFNPAWSPDGTQIAYTAMRTELRPQNSEGWSELWVVSAQGGEARRLVDADTLLPSWSPHGLRIAYGGRLGIERQGDLLTVPVGGGESIPVTTDRFRDWNPVWAPDGTYLYFLSDRAGSMNIWRVAIDEASGRPRGEPEPITSPAPFAAHLTISADGRRLAYSSVLETQNIHKLTLNPVSGEVVGEPELVTTGTRFWSSPDPSPDGRSVVMYSQVNPEGDLYVVDVATRQMRQLTQDRATDRVPRWSPDGQWIAAFSDRDGTLQVWKIRPDGSDLAQVTETRDAAYVAWSPDAGRMAVTLASAGTSSGGSSANAPGSAIIMDPRRPWSGQTAEIVPRAPEPHPRFAPNSWSPDGRWLIGENGLGTFVISMYSVHDRTFQRLTDFGQWPVWLPDSRRVLFVSRGREFHILDTVTKNTKQIFSVVRDTLGPPRLTRDGRTAFFSRRVTEADIWLVNLQ